MQDSPNQTSQQDVGPDILAVETEEGIISPADDLSSEESEVVQHTNEVDASVTITRTTTIANNSDGSVIHEAAVTRTSNLASSEAKEDEFIEELLGSGWTSRGRPDRTSVPAPIVPQSSKSQSFDKGKDKAQATADAKQLQKSAQGNKSSKKAGKS